jgi:hypothetical protein
MKARTRRRLALAPVLVVSAAILLAAADIVSPGPIDLPSHPADLTVHEWGTFTSVAGEDGSAIEWNTLGCKDDLPEFVKEFGYRNFKWRVRGTVRMETPVIYFYSPREVDAHVKVAFPHGLITEWYPQAEHQVYQTTGQGGAVRQLDANISGIDTSLRSVTGAIEWTHIKVQPDTAPALPLENGPSRYYAARETDAAPLAVGDQHEKFLFYRGVGSFKVPLAVRRSQDGTFVVENRDRDPVPGVILFENRGGRLGFRRAGAVDDRVTLDPPVLDDSFPQLRYELEHALVDQGLFPKEAQAMVETWRDSWFEEGARLIYIMPAASVDEVLPLRIDPAPSRTARVFVGRIELLTPDVLGTVAEALARKDWSTIDRHRRFLQPILERIDAGSRDKADQALRLFQQMAESLGTAVCR